jgi:hypothetical protein
LPLHINIIIAHIMQAGTHFSSVLTLSDPEAIDFNAAVPSELRAFRQPADRFHFEIKSR